jgi:hypothetical protein
MIPDPQLRAPLLEVGDGLLELIGNRFGFVLLMSFRVLTCTPHPGLISNDGLARIFGTSQAIAGRVT